MHPLAKALRDNHGYVTLGDIKVLAVRFDVDTDLQPGGQTATLVHDGPPQGDIIAISTFGRTTLSSTLQ